MEIRPLEGPGPWSLVDVADAAGISYDLVYRDIRQGILPVQAQRRGGGHHRYAVTAEALRRSARACYHRVVPGGAGAVQATTKRERGAKRWA